MRERYVVNEFEEDVWIKRVINELNVDNKVLKMIEFYLLNLVFKLWIFLM